MPLTVYCTAAINLLSDSVSYTTFLFSNGVSTIILLKSTRVFHSKLINGGFLALRYCLRTIGYCFPIIFKIEENKVIGLGDSSIPPTMETMSTLPVS